MTTTNPIPASRPDEFLITREFDAPRQMGLPCESSPNIRWARINETEPGPRPAQLAAAHQSPS